MAGLFYWQATFDYQRPDRNRLADPGPVIHASGGPAIDSLDDDELIEFKRCAYHYAFRTLGPLEEDKQTERKIHRGIIWFENTTDLPEIFLDYKKQFNASDMEIFFFGGWKNISEMEIE